MRQISQWIKKNHQYINVSNIFLSATNMWMTRNKIMGMKRTKKESENERVNKRWRGRQNEYLTIEKIIFGNIACLN